jgi:trimeric autotransporter adhesin
MANKTGNDDIIIGYMENMGSNNWTNATAIGANAIVNANNKIVLGNSSATTVGGYGTWSNFSDRRLKENIVYKNDLGLNFIIMLKTVTFNYITDKNKRRRDGLIAQDVQKVLKDLNLDFSGLVVDDDKDKTLNLSYGEVVIPLINAVQEQQKQIEELNALVNSLIANQTGQGNN